jgi:hypothetical protein
MVVVFNYWVVLEKTRISKVGKIVNRTGRKELCCRPRLSVV